MPVCITIFRLALIYLITICLMGTYYSRGMFVCVGTTIQEMCSNKCERYVFIEYL